MEGDKWRLVGQLTSCPKVGVREYGTWRTEVNSHGSCRVRGAALGGPKSTHMVTAGFRGTAQGGPKSTHEVTAGQGGQMMTHGGTASTAPIVPEGTECER